MKRLLPLLAVAALSTPALADSYVAPKNAAYTEECGSCHIAYPPGMLDANSWQALMGGLSKHFGVDASLDDKQRAAIGAHLARYAGGRKTGTTVDRTGRPLLRISETRHFIHEHDEVAASTWKRASIKSPANCGACHPRAADGDFNEHRVSIPN